MPTVKVIEVVGTSEKGWEDAARNALLGAQRTIHNITGIEVTNWTARVSGAEIAEYRATIKLAFRVDE
jgi:flavin-binding protein dodecin